MNLNPGKVQLDLNTVLDFPEGKEVPFYNLELAAVPSQLWNA